MPTVFGSLRRLVLTPPLADVTFAGRGFTVAPSAATRHLEAVPQAVICGFEWGIETPGQWELERRLSLTDPEVRGFAYEGATMALTVRDVMGVRRGRRTRDLLLGPGRPHIFLAYIGIGFAMGRLPRPLWKKVVPDLTGVPYHPTMSWLAVDGYGFDRAYFDTARWVERRHEPEPYPWDGSPDYFRRAVDQGIGRALWFIHGGVVPDVAAAVSRFADRRRADLWSGVGLAATFAGGCGPGDLAVLRREAGGEQDHLAQGAVFAAKARGYAGFVPDYTHTAISALTGMSTESAVALADDTAVEPGRRGSTPDYEIWRGRVRAHFAPATDGARRA